MLSNIVQNFLLHQLRLFLQLLNYVLHLLLKYVPKAQTMFKLPKHETKSTLESKLINFWTELGVAKTGTADAEENFGQYCSTFKI